jgi:hypothetical protein
MKGIREVWKERMLLLPLEDQDGGLLRVAVLLTARQLIASLNTILDDFLCAQLCSDSRSVLIIFLADPSLETSRFVQISRDAGHNEWRNVRYSNRAQKMIVHQRKFDCNGTINAKQR